MAAIDEISIPIKKGWHDARDSEGESDKNTKSVIHNTHCVYVHMRKWYNKTHSAITLQTTRQKYTNCICK